MKCDGDGRSRRARDGFVSAGIGVKKEGRSITPFQFPSRIADVQKLFQLIRVIVSESAMLI